MIISMNALSKRLKQVSFILFYVVMVAMAIATIVEKYNGTDYVSSVIYGSWWFCLLWGVLSVAGLVYFIGRKLKSLSLWLLHISFVVILCGALLTHLFSDQGMVHLRLGEPVSTYVMPDETKGMVKKNLPFTLVLNRFQVHYYNGTEAAMDYSTDFTVKDGNESFKGSVSMNNIFAHKSVRLYQSSYDEDGKGSILSLNSDPWGIPVTYAGYALLFISLVWMLFDPRGQYRQLLKHPLWKKGILASLLLFALTGGAKAATVVPEATAERFGHLFILYNNRVCPVQTLAIDFTKKLYGEASYKDYSAEQVLLSWIFWGQEWDNEPVLKVKSDVLRKEFNLPEYASVSSFFNQLQGGYILGPLVQEYYQENKQDALHKAAVEMDDKLQLVMSLRRGTLLQLFPYTQGKRTSWYSPTSDLPKGMEKLHRIFIQQVFNLLMQDAMTGNWGHFGMISGKMLIYQQKNAGNSLPSTASVKAERMYNAFPYTKVLFIVNLAVGFLTFFYAVWRLLQQNGQGGKHEKRVTGVALGIMALSFLTLTLCLGLRWTISGKVPMGNGYETMLTLAWFVQLITFFVYRKLPFLLSFGFLLSGFFLLVSFIGQMDPQITPLMPVLLSPLLSVHVSLIMMSFALLSFTFLCGLTALILVMMKGGRNELVKERLESLRLVSRLFLYPALTLLGAGIFVGAIWANVSWGRYWSWDPKEVWALITFMFYGAVVHTHSLPAFRKPLAYHIYVTLAFLMVLMTYFGVNYYLGGMHSYAG